MENNHIKSGSRTLDLLVAFTFHFELMQGVVIIDAILDEQGNVIEAKITSGPPLLILAALDEFDGGSTKRRT